MGRGQFRRTGDSKAERRSLCVGDAGIPSAVGGGNRAQERCGGCGESAPLEAWLCCRREGRGARARQEGGLGRLC